MERTNPESESRLFEEEFAAHVFSLFASLYDSRASPYMGPIEYSSEEEAEEEIFDESESYPAFGSALCDFRLRDSYNSEVEERKNLLYSFFVGEEALDENLRKGTPEPITIGERLPTCKPVHYRPPMPQTRPNKSGPIIPRDKLEEKARIEASDKIYARKKKILQKQEEQKLEERKKLSQKHIKAMEQKRKEREQKKEEDFEKEQEASKLIQSFENIHPRKSDFKQELLKEQAARQHKELQEKRAKTIEAGHRYTQQNQSKSPRRASKDTKVPLLNI